MVCGESRYQPVEPAAEKWGLYVVDAGYTHISEGQDYPPGHHPDEYQFSWEQGRNSLSEYQLVYITRGKGDFESRAAGKLKVDAGDVFFLHPGSWHRYRPLRSMGWDEQWVGFGGDIAERIMRDFFPPERPLFRVGQHADLFEELRAVGRRMKEAPVGYQQGMAANVLAALGMVRALSLQQMGSRLDSVTKTQEARRYLLAHYRECVDLEALARRLGMSYSMFRAAFKEETGTSPYQYQLEIRMKHARDLLAHSEMRVIHISERLGFSSVFHFSKTFKQRSGHSPTQFRRSATST